MWTAEFILQLMWGAAASFLTLTIVFWPLERMLPAKADQPALRPGWATDACFFLGQYLVWNSLILSIMLILRDWCDAVTPAAVRETVQALPWWAQAGASLFLGDLAIYWGHRFQHKYDWLWHFHAVHHSCEHMDWLAAHRDHPVDGIFTAAVTSLPGYLLGVPLEMLAGALAFRAMWNIYIHSNVRLPIGPLRLVLGAPELHHWHHDRDRFNGNYANVLPVLDVLFGTYSCPPHEPASFGLRDEYPRTYLGQLAQPFRALFRRRTEGVKSKAGHSDQDSHLTASR